jgi:hypothetical protein
MKALTPYVSAMVSRLQFKSPKTTENLQFCIFESSDYVDRRWLDEVFWIQWQ